MNKALIYILGLVIVIGAAIYISYNKGYNVAEGKYQTQIDMLSAKLAAKEQGQAIENVPIENVPIETKQDTKIVYVERPAADNAQVKITNDIPKVVTEYNGKQYEFNTLIDEQHAFEKGQLQILQKSEINVDVTEIVNEQLSVLSKQIRAEVEAERKNKSIFGIGYGYTGNSQMAGVKYQKNHHEVLGFGKVNGDGDRFFVGYIYNIDV
jgi:hypothetical protein